MGTKAGRLGMRPSDPGPAAREHSSPRMGGTVWNARRQTPLPALPSHWGMPRPGLPEMECGSPMRGHGAGIDRHCQRQPPNPRDLSDETPHVGQGVRHPHSGPARPIIGGQGRRRASSDTGKRTRTALLRPFAWPSRTTLRRSLLAPAKRDVASLNHSPQWCREPRIAIHRTT